jgi:hypothetical protein
MAGFIWRLKRLRYHPNKTWRLSMTDPIFNIGDTVKYGQQFMEVKVISRRQIRGGQWVYKLENTPTFWWGEQALVKSLA